MAQAAKRPSRAPRDPAASVLRREGPPLTRAAEAPTLAVQEPGPCCVCGEQARVVGICPQHAACDGCWQGYLAVNFVEKKKSLDGIPCVGGAACGAVVFNPETFEALTTAPELLQYLAAYQRTIPADLASAGFQDFNYAYDAEGVLRNTETGSLFHWVNQAHYDRLGDLVVGEVQRQMVEDFGLVAVQMPLDAAEGEPTTTVFASPDFQTAPGTAMVLIQGSGAVRPGQWARALCINDSLRTGSVLPYLEKTRAAGVPVLVLNPNDNKAKVGDAEVRIRGSEDPQAHTVSAWDSFVTPAAARTVLIVAHSAGGACTFALLRQRTAEVLARVAAVAFTDAVHWLLPQDPAEVRAFCRDGKIKDWVASDKPLDTPERSQADGIPCVSAGHTAHVHTSASAMESVFQFFDGLLGPQGPPAGGAAAPVS